MVFEESCLEQNGKRGASAVDPRMLDVILSQLAFGMGTLIEKNEKCGATLPVIPELCAFHGLRAPDISIRAYLERIEKYADCSPQSFVVAYVYIVRLCTMYPDFAITSTNVHRLLITAIMIAAKFLDDIYFNNSYYAKVGGISCAELNLLERNFLRCVDFDLNVTEQEFTWYLRHLEKIASNPKDAQVCISNMTLTSDQCHLRVSTANDIAVCS
eukprot:jgi/Mesvir1/12003/Mv00307-RA.1